MVSFNSIWQIHVGNRALPLLVEMPVDRNSGKSIRGDLGVIFCDTSDICDMTRRKLTPFSPPGVWEGNNIYYRKRYSEPPTPLMFVSALCRRNCVEGTTGAGSANAAVSLGALHSLARCARSVGVVEVSIQASSCTTSLTTQGSLLFTSLALCLLQAGDVEVGAS